jgi:hypothetical protein
MKKLIFGCFCLILTAISCKKSDPAPDPAASQFITTTPGTTWNYQVTDNSTSAVTPYTLTSSTVDTTINGKTYHIYNSTDANTPKEYYNLTGNDYYQYSQLAAQLPSIELLYLNDIKAVGQSWATPISTTMQGVTLTADIKNTIEEKGGSISVNGITYSNIIKMKTEVTNVSANNPFVTIDPITQNIESYFAPKYGLVKREFQLHVSATALGTSMTVIDQNTTNILMSSSIQ